MLNRLMDRHGLLLQAKEDLMERGWCQGFSGEGPDGSICLGRAITGCFSGSEPRYLTESASNLARAIIKDKYGPVYNIPTWNDHPDTTFEMVMDVLDQAILESVPVGNERATVTVS